MDLKKLRRGSLHVEVTVDSWYYPLCFMGTGIFHRFHNRSDSVDITCDCNRAGDYMADTPGTQTLGPYPGTEKLNGKASERLIQGGSDT